MRNRNRSVWMSLLVVLGLALLLVILANPGAVASAGENATREAIAKTDLVIAHMHELVTELESERGERAVIAADHMQTNAREALDRGDVAEAHRLTIEARERALQAVGGTPPPPQGTQRVEKELRATDRYLNNLKRPFGRHRPSPERGKQQGGIIGNLEKRQARAWEYYRRDELRPALRETLAVREHLDKLRERFGQGPQSRRDRRGRMEAEVLRIGSFIARAEQMIGDRHPRAVAHLNIAKAAHQAALGALAEGDPHTAEALMRDSHEALLEVLKRAAATLDEEEFRELAGEAHDRWKGIAESAAEADSLRTRRLLRRADGSLDKAERAFYQGEKKAALLSLFHAMNILDEAGDAAPR